MISMILNHPHNVDHPIGTLIIDIHIMPILIIALRIFEENFQARLIIEDDSSCLEVSSRKEKDLLGGRG